MGYADVLTCDLPIGIPMPTTGFGADLYNSHDCTQAAITAITHTVDTHSYVNFLTLKLYFETALTLNCQSNR
jgi:hypothetical protein